MYVYSDRAVSLALSNMNEPSYGCYFTFSVAAARYLCIACASQLLSDILNMATLERWLIWHGLCLRTSSLFFQVPQGGSKKALVTLGELLQRLLHLLSHVSEAAPLLEARGSTPPPVQDPPPSAAKTPSLRPPKQQPSGKASSRKWPADSAPTGSASGAKQIALDAPPMPELPQVQKLPPTWTTSVMTTSACRHLPLYKGLAAQALLAAELQPRREALEPLEGRWWKKRWSGDRAKSALAAAIASLQVPTWFSV